MVTELDVLNRLTIKDWFTALEIAQQIKSERGTDPVMLLPSTMSALRRLIDMDQIDYRPRRAAGVKQLEYQLLEKGLQRRNTQNQAVPIDAEAMA
jgi:hypothetical protein